MSHNKRQVQGFIAVALLGGLIAGSPVQAGGFSSPTFGAPGWGRAFGGGSLFKNDPAAAYNNPAAMAFIDQAVAQMTVDYARINIKYKGKAYGYDGNELQNAVIDPVFGDITQTGVRGGDGGEGGFTAWVPTGFMVIPINDQLSFGLSQVVPQGMRTTWDQDWKGRDFAVDTKIETVGLTGSLAYKVNEQFSVGAGMIVQRSQGFVSQNIDLLGAAAMVGILPVPPGVGDALMRVKVDNTSVGWFAGIEWKPTLQDSVGLNYHAKIKNKLEGKYTIRADEFLGGIIDAGIPGLAYPGLDLKRNGADATTQLDIPATASVDWVHQFNDRLTLGASVTWTQWSSFESLTLKSDGNLIVAIPYNYKDSWMYSLGGDYKLTDQFTLRAGMALDQTPTRNSTRDPRIPDGDRIFASLGFGYDLRAIPGLTIDGAYSRQFVEEVKIKTVNQDRLGGSRLDGKAESKGEVVSLSATYRF